MAKRPIFKIDGQRVRRGETADVRLKMSEHYTGDPVTLPLRVVRAKRPGPNVFVTAAVHGDEINGTGIIHDLMFGNHPPLQTGTLILAPALNIFGFETQDRYMPDRRDLNRSFPGFENGSLTSRFAYIIFNQIVRKCDFGIDLHSAGAPRTNYPNVRGDLANAAVRRIARAFGCELIVHGKGPAGSLRREATRAGCPTIILEAGEPRKMEPGVLDIGVRGVHNVLRELGMMTRQPQRPSYQVRINKSTWVRAQMAGILRFHVSPGQWVEKEQPIASNASVFGENQNVLTAPVKGVILGMTTLPTVKPGEPVCHIAIPGRSYIGDAGKRKRLKQDQLHERVQSDLATSISVSENTEAVADETSREVEQ